MRHRHTARQRVGETKREEIERRKERDIDRWTDRGAQGHISTTNEKVKKLKRMRDREKEEKE